MQESLISTNQKGAELTIELTQSSTDQTAIKFHRIQIILGTLGTCSLDVFILDLKLKFKLKRLTTHLIDKFLIHYCQLQVNYKCGLNNIYSIYF